MVKCKYNLILSLENRIVIEVDNQEIRMFYTAK